MADEKSNENSERPPSLDDALLALQKTFSRVSDKTPKESAEKARALITGTVDFQNPPYRSL